MSLSTLTLHVVQTFPDADEIVMSFDMPVIVDPVNAEQVSEIVAFYVNDMAVALKALDKDMHRVQ